MGKYFFALSQFPYSWDQVASIFWMRYPNPYSKHVLSEDVISREVTADGKLRTKRLLTKTNKMPRWGQFLTRGGVVSIVEESVVDPVGRTIISYTRNIGYTKIMTVEEKCRYRDTDGDSSTSMCEREAWITSSIRGFSKPIEVFGCERFKHNAGLSYNGVKHVLENRFPVQPIVTENHLNVKKLIPDKERVKDAARKAKEYAHSKTPQFIHVVHADF